MSIIFLNILQLSLNINYILNESMVTIISSCGWADTTGGGYAKGIVYCSKVLEHAFLSSSTKLMYKTARKTTLCPLWNHNSRQPSASFG